MSKYNFNEEYSFELLNTSLITVEDETGMQRELIKSTIKTSGGEIEISEWVIEDEDTNEKKIDRDDSNIEIGNMICIAKIFNSYDVRFLSRLITKIHDALDQELTKLQEQ